jgi:hypothetical protein
VFVAELPAFKALNNVSISIVASFCGRHPQTRIFVVVWRADGDVYAHEIKILRPKRSSCVSANAINSEGFISSVTAILSRYS